MRTYSRTFFMFIYCCTFYMLVKLVAAKPFGSFPNTDCVSETILTQKCIKQVPSCVLSVSPLFKVSALLLTFYCVIIDNYFSLFVYVLYDCNVCCVWCIYKFTQALFSKKKKKSIFSYSHLYLVVLLFSGNASARLFYRITGLCAGQVQF